MIAVNWCYVVDMTGGELVDHGNLRHCYSQNLAFEMIGDSYEPKL